MLQKRRQHYFLRSKLLLACMLLCSLFCTVTQIFAKQKPVEAISVSVTQVAQRDVTLYADAVGSAQAHDSVALKSQVDGQLLKVNFKEGDFVQAGQVLFTIDPQNFSIKVQQQQSIVAHDEAQLALADSAFKRNSELANKGYISKQDYDRLKTDVSSLQATLKGDQAALASAQLQLNYCTIRAPISGKTGSVMFTVGNLIKVNDQTTSLVVINQIDPIDIKFSLSEENFLAVKNNLKTAPITVQAYIKSNNSLIKQGNLTFLDNAVDAQTGMIQLKATFANKDQYFWPGQFVNVKIPTATIKQALLVPTRAIQIGQSGPYLYVADNKIAHVKPITLGAAVGEETIVNNVQAGELVVLEGQARLKEGARIN